MDATHSQIEQQLQQIKKTKKKQHEESQIWKKDLQAKRTHVETELQENKAQLHALETKQATLKKEWKA
ncbi:hypothetical protein [Listeria seeligeri]|uniref:hypothetical protein n=1 Tax=Listeria seeligeri TaxID=1640 RepID=UPI0010B177F7|nr:hypothetical protein [Listeria seeligeri]MBC1932971.1 hypothetical protein [Listeria seeligeri]MBF2545606.1 hypothetical protein [Listeria seeligeri]MBF2642841.1 hypothetical protein [Listeria seeligeri]